MSHKRLIQLILLQALLSCSFVHAEQDKRPIFWTEVASYQQPHQLPISGTTRNSIQAILSFETSGKVEKVLVDVGDEVRKGQVLAQLEQTERNLEVAELASVLEEAKSIQFERLLDYKRRKNLIVDGWVSQESYEISQTRLKSANANVDAVTARLNQAKKRVADGILVAPYAGSISRRLIEQSQNIAARQEAFHILGSKGQVEVVIHLPESLIFDIEVNSQHLVMIPGLSEEPIPATMSEISSTTANTNSFEATLQIDGNFKTVKSGLTAQVLLQTKVSKTNSPASLFIPHGAFLASQNDIIKVFRYNRQDSTLSDVALKVVALDKDGVLATGPLKPGEIIASKGVSFLSNGQEVTLLADKPLRYNP